MKEEEEEEEEEKDEAIDGVKPSSSLPLESLLDGREDLDVEEHLHGCFYRFYLYHCYLLLCMILTMATHNQEWYL